MLVCCRTNLERNIKIVYFLMLMPLKKLRPAESKWYLVNIFITFE